MTDLNMAKAARLKQRYAALAIFKLYGQLAIAAALSAVFFLLYTIFTAGYSAFWRTQIQSEVTLNANFLKVTPQSSNEELARANYLGLFRKNVVENNPDIKSRSERRDLIQMFSESAETDLRDLVLSDPSLLGATQKLWFLASSPVDTIVKGAAPRDIEEERRVVSNLQLRLLDQWTAEDRVGSTFNINFFTRGDSRNPELAGLAGAIAGSFWALLVCFVISFPMGIAAAIYLEEFASKNRITEVIEVNINNLAAVPSIIFGLLGMAVILNFFGVPRSTPLAGGIVLSLMTLPTIIIACRAALKAVPPSIPSRGSCHGGPYTGSSSSCPTTCATRHFDRYDHWVGSSFR